MWVLSEVSGLAATVRQLKQHSELADRIVMSLASYQIYRNVLFPACGETVTWSANGASNGDCDEPGPSPENPKTRKANNRQAPTL